MGEWLRAREGAESIDIELKKVATVPLTVHSHRGERCCCWCVMVGFNCKNVT